jgi:hypothetical protein
MDDATLALCLGGRENLGWQNERSPLKNSLVLFDGREKSEFKSSMPEITALCFELMHKRRFNLIGRCVAHMIGEFYPNVTSEPYKA